MNQEYSYTGWYRFLFLWAPYLLGPSIMVPGTFVMLNSPMPHYLAFAMPVAAMLYVEYAMLRALPTSIHITDDGLELGRFLTYRRIAYDAVIAVEPASVSGLHGALKVLYSAGDGARAFYILRGMGGIDELVKAIRGDSSTQGATVRSASWGGATLWVMRFTVVVFSIACLPAALVAVLPGESIGGRVFIGVWVCVVALSVPKYAARTVVSFEIGDGRLVFVPLFGRRISVAPSDVQSIVADTVWPRFIGSRWKSYTVHLRSGRELWVDDRIGNLEWVTQEIRRAANLPEQT